MKRKKVFTALTALLLSAVLMLSGFFSAYAVSFDFTPNTPKEYHDLPSALFSMRSLSTGNNDYYTNDNWKYYYWCDFCPQYSADYTLTVSSIRKMKIELYDADNNLLASAFSPETYDEEYRYVFSLTYPMEQGVTYYYKIAFTGGNFNSCGTFFIYFESTGGPLVESDDNLHLYVNGSKNRTVFEKSTYTWLGFLESLSMKVVYKDGKLYQWTEVDNGYFTLNGCDILFNFSDCEDNVGTHKVFVHYMGYYAEATYQIVDCIHTYEEAFAQPEWLEPGQIQMVCSKCGDVIVEDYTPTGYELSTEFMSRLNSVDGDGVYESYADLDNNGIINIRDYKFLSDMYATALEGVFIHFNEKDTEEAFEGKYDINNDGVINIRDYSLLLFTYKLE